MVWDAALAGLGGKSGRYGCETCNCLWTLDTRPRMAGHLGGLSYGKRFDANRRSLGIPFHDCLVAGWWRLQRGQCKG